MMAVLESNFLNIGRFLTQAQNARSLMHATECTFPDTAIERTLPDACYGMHAS